jgi:ligand-binding sensor domain-containing protein/two-component sensor histidine kinase
VRVLKRVAAITLLLFWPEPGQAQRLPLKAYTVADGLPHNAVNRIVRDRRGFLWFATAEGFALFDGYEFTRYGVEEGLPNSYVADILQTREGEYWIATRGGLARFDPKGSSGSRAADAIVRHRPAPMFTVVTPSGDDRHARVLTKLLQRRDGSIWCGTEKGLFRLDRTADRIELLPVDINLPAEYAQQSFISTLMEDRHGTLWVGAASGLYRLWPDGSAIRYGKAEGLADESIHDVLEDRLGYLWVATRFGGLLRMTIDADHKPPVITNAFNRNNGLGTDWVFDVHEGSDGTLWVGTNGGLVEFPPSQRDVDPAPSRIYTKNNGFIYHEIANVTEDHDGNLWLGVQNGAMKLVHNGFSTFSEQQGLLIAHSLFESIGGELYLFAYGRNQRQFRDPASHVPLIGRFDGSGFAWFQPSLLKRNLSWTDKGFMLQASSGEWWIGTNAGLYRFSRAERLETASRVAIYSTRHGLAVPTVYSLYEDSRGNVWVSTVSSWLNGLARWEPETGTVRDMGTTNGLPPLIDRLPVAFEEDIAGDMWVGFSPGGLARYARGGFELLDIDDGLPPGRIEDLYRDHAGRLWIATAGGGLGRIDDTTAERPKAVKYSTRNGLSGNVITAITEDLQGRIYAATGRGVDRLTPSTGRVEHFASADGLAGGKITAALRDRAGNLWFATDQGLSRFLPEPERRSVPPPVLINGLRVEGEPGRVSALGEAAIDLPSVTHDRNQIQIDFVGLSFTSGEMLRYQYKLEGADADWSAPSDQRSVNFANLSPGHYRFLVRAINSDGVISLAPAAVTVTILPPIWKRWWFLCLCTFAVALVFYQLHRYRVSRLLALERVRRRIASDLHDDIGAGLSRIAVLSEIARHESDSRSPVAERLTAIASAARELVDSMSDIVWVIKPDRDQLSDLTQRMRRFASDVLTSRGIALTFRAPEDDQRLPIGADLRRHVFLIFKECVNNAARHSECAAVDIELDIVGGWLKLTISDNGKGFDPENVDDGNGVTNIRDRAASLRGQVRFDSGNGVGTRIVVTIPLKPATEDRNLRLRASRR